MKRGLIVSSTLTAISAASSAGAVDVTLGGTIDVGIEYGVGKSVGAKHWALGSNYQNIALSLTLAGTTDAGLKFGAAVGMSTADELVFDPWHVGANGKTASATSGRTNDQYIQYPPNRGKRSANNNKYAYKLVNTEASANVRGNAFAISGGREVTAGQIVSVKIGSSWVAAADKVSKFTSEIATLRSGGVCKIAGNYSNGFGLLSRTDGNGDVVQFVDVWLPWNAPKRPLPLPAGQKRSGEPGAPYMSIDPTAGSVLRIYEHSNGTLVASTNWSPIVNFTIDRAVFGPVMAVRMTSSTTKMVIGNACLMTAIDATETQIHMDAVSRVLHTSDASVFIEGGFGRLSIGTDATKGSVDGIGTAGDQVSIDGKVNATLASVSFLGFSGHGAVAVDSINLSERPNYAFGMTTNLLGLTVAVEMEDVQAGDDGNNGNGLGAGGTDLNTWIDHWDAGTSYDLNGMAISLATDSAGAWAMSLAYELLGFGASTVIENIPGGSSVKAGLNIDTTLKTNFNGVDVSVGFDEHFAWTLGAQYQLGSSGLDMYVTYSRADQGGKLGAKIAF